ncbi:hypothetical protein L5515_018837 [Caenorhabditis briggsae]|uniref:Uncharacterized protein n=1 Tax=Caenorhabditis briggsae TaxID=6238 RepID=A0AAE9FKB9_CAEBR|nr:hypothetical protein L5515_018837 [Caenorhabditis briggsae]
MHFLVSRSVFSKIFLKLSSFISIHQLFLKHDPFSFSSLCQIVTGNSQTISVHANFCQKNI